MLFEWGCKGRSLLLFCSELVPERSFGRCRSATESKVGFNHSRDSKREPAEPAGRETRPAPAKRSRESTVYWRCRRNSQYGVLIAGTAGLAFAGNLLGVNSRQIEDALKETSGRAATRLGPVLKTLPPIPGQVPLTCVRPPAGLPPRCAVRSCVRMEGQLFPSGELYYLRTPKDRRGPGGRGRMARLQLAGRTTE